MSSDDARNELLNALGERPYAFSLFATLRQYRKPCEQLLECVGPVLARPPCKSSHLEIFHDTERGEDLSSLRNVREPEMCASRGRHCVQVPVLPAHGSAQWTDDA